MVNLSKYIGKSFIKLADVADGPVERTIVAIEDGNYVKADLVLNSGERLSLNTTNMRTLFKAFGGEPADWPGKRIEIFEGMLPYKGGQQLGLRVRAINPPAQKSSDGGDF